MSDSAGRNRYFGAFQEDVLRSFYETFEQWELAMVIQDLADAKVLDLSSTSGHASLSDVHPAVIYRMVCNWTIFSDPRVLAVIHASSLTKPLSGWPTDPLPAGMLILLMNDNLNVRQWAVSQASKCLAVPISDHLFVGSYFQAVEAITHGLTATESGLALREPHPFSFTPDLSSFWSAFSVALRHIPVAALASGTGRHADLRRIVTGHLHDTGPR